MSFIAILSATPEGRVGKYAGFETLAEAQAHADEFVAEFPEAFAVETPAAPWNHWLVDMVAGTVGIKDRTDEIAAEKDAIAAREVAQIIADILRRTLNVQFELLNQFRVSQGQTAITLQQYVALLEGATGESPITLAQFTDYVRGKL